MSSPQEIATVWRHETRRAFRSARGLSLMVLFLFAQGLTLGVGGCMNVGANDQFDKMVTDQGIAPEAARESLVTKKVEFLKMLTRDSDSTVAAIAEIPIVLLVVFFVTLLMLPLLIALMGFDQISAEIGPRSIRYLLIRAERGNVLFGKYLSQVTVLTVLLGVSVAAMLGVTKYLNPDFSWGQTVLWFARLWLASLVVGAVYAALTSLCSALTRLGPLSLFLNIIVLFSLWLFGLIGYLWVLPGSTGLFGQKESVFAYVRYLLPAKYESQMLSQSPLELFSGMIAFAGFAFIFLALGKLVLEKRDV